MSLFLLTVVLTGFSFEWVGTGEDFIDVTAYPWLSPESITATVNGDTLGAALSARGTTVGIVLHPSPLPGDTVLIMADTLAISTPMVAKLELQPAGTGAPLILPTYRAGAALLPEGLYISGSKQLGVSVGSGGGISQGTELSIQGMLSPGINVNGRVTDRELPLGASSSESLSELDKVYLEVSGQSWNAEMGDLEWESTGPVQWQSDPSGFHGGVIFAEKHNLSAGYGTSGSERHRNTFLTQEGLQGPYSFAPEGGVTPGSEKVFLDGELLGRGTGADYVVDYSAGLITFNTVRLIRRDQRVDVSWYREGDGFRNDLATGVAVIGLQDDLQFSFSTFSRADNTDVPLGFVMSDEIEEVLTAAGEDPSEAWIEGGTYAGEGNGSYTLDSLSRYQWAGPGLGDWTVEFQKPPEGTGDYVYNSSLGGYVWAGEGYGTHLPRRYLSIPASNRIAGGEFTGSSGIVEQFSLHSTYSEQKGNLFNPSATTREGTLTGSSVSFRPLDAGPLFSLSGRYISSGFTPPDDLDSDKDLQRWGLPAGWTGRDSYFLGEVAGDALTVSGGRRILESGGTSDVAETEVRAESGVLSVSTSASGLFRNGSNQLLSGKKGVFSAEASVRTGSFTPFLLPSYTAESWPDSLSGVLFAGDAGVRHESSLWNSTFSAGMEIDNRTGIVHPDRTLRVGAVTSGTGDSWNAGGSVQHSTGWFTGGGSTSSDAVKASWSGRHGGLWTHGRYTAGGYISREMNIVYTWVGSGNGSYSYDPDAGEYYADPSGDYIQTFEPGQGESRVLESDLSGGFSWADSTDSAGLDGNFSLSASDADDRLSTYTLAGAFDTETPGEWSGSLSPFLSWEESTMSRLTLKVSGFDRVEEFSGSGTTRESYRKLEVIPFLKPENWLEIEFDGATAYRRRSLYGIRETDENSFSADPVFVTGSGLDIGLKLSVEHRADRTGEYTGTAWGIDPHTVLNSSGWSASGRLQCTYIPGEEELPSWFFDGEQIGWTLEPNLRVGRNLNQWFRVSLFYWGRKRPGAEWEQRAGLDGTVNF